MRAFCGLFQQLDATTSTNAKVAAMVEYFQKASPEDAAWAAYCLSGQRLKRLVSARDLQHWSLALTELPEWLYQESYHAVGDTAETIALLLGGGVQTEADLPLHVWMEKRIQPLGSLSKAEQSVIVQGWWQNLDTNSILVLNKLMTGAFRVGVSKTLVFRALAQIAGLEAATITQRLSGPWLPSGDLFRQVLSDSPMQADIASPFPFYLAHPLDNTGEGLLGPREDWLAEWKWDGIRGQLMHRQHTAFIWSRGEELITKQFPELVTAAEQLPEGTTLDGEILAWSENAPLDFATLQQRLGRKKPGKKILQDAPVYFLAYDLLEYQGEDWRGYPLQHRRQQLETLLQQTPVERVRLSPAIADGSWEDLTHLREKSRERGVEGLMLKRLDSSYGVGRRKGDWWKWKIEPYTVDAVLLYAQPGSGRRANLYTDYTFAVWDDDKLVPIAKAYSGLTDEEIRRVDRWIRQHTIERFGPVRSVTPELVFEIAFENIAASSRHKSGIAVRFPRIKRWRDDKPVSEADTLALMHEFIEQHAKHSPITASE